ncbi:MAG: GNAT family N-acetyltransferase [Clostridia bacterium]|nr:GNAT family N-acetyltransferase [Clostridia bacterium]
MDEVRKNQLIKLHRDCFNDGGYADFFFERRVDENNSFIIEENGEILSACYARIFELDICGKRVEIPFLTGVATNPNHRYKGYARKVVESAKNVLKKRGYPFVLLHPFNHDFYRKLGFETFNFIKRIVPSGNAPIGVTIKKMTKSSLPVVHDLYSKLITSYGAYRIRSMEETDLLIGYSLEHGGFGYVISENGTPKGYVWCEDGNCVEGLAEREDLLYSLSLPQGYSIPIFGGNEDYSMGAVLNLKELFKVIPYHKNANASVLFTLAGVNYNLSVKNGNFLSLTETSESGVPLTEKEIISISLGQGYLSENNPFKKVIPNYTIACFEIY